MTLILRLSLGASLVAASSSLATDQPKMPTPSAMTTKGWVGGSVPAVVASGILVAAAAAFAPVAVADVDIVHGEAIFKAECAGCHAGGQNFMSEKKTLKKEALEKFQSLDAAKLKTFVQSQMPHQFLPFHSKLGDGEFEDVVGYVLDQAQGDKW